MLSARILLVRHGQSTHNAQARLQGQADPPLSDAGRAEAELLKPALPAFEDHRVVTSDLQRAAQTAALLGYPGARRDPRFREINVGEWEGRPLSDFPAGPETAWRGGALRAPDGESWSDLQTRVGNALDELIAQGGTWLVVCHGGVVRAALSHVTGADPTHVAGPGNATVTIVRANERPQLETYGWAPVLSAH
ncbi:histidine phosphatase family protein [Solirubrobacter soli]|uniref:histidine phosphatase family protein n=1 Tax=Solirubrobacter soli TaxID=363832 RepID=UPI00041019EB|nr:histidine phosphatase family protein [Solirubrobacter soli]